jgi:hypothetical protein
MQATHNPTSQSLLFVLILFVGQTAAFPSHINEATTTGFSDSSHSSHPNNNNLLMVYSGGGRRGGGAQAPFDEQLQQPQQQPGRTRRQVANTAGVDVDAPCYATAGTTEHLECPDLVGEDACSDGSTGGGSSAMGGMGRARHRRAKVKLSQLVLMYTGEDCGCGADTSGCNSQGKGCSSRNDLHFPFARQSLDPSYTLLLATGGQHTHCVRARVRVRVRACVRVRARVRE